MCLSRCPRLAPAVLCMSSYSAVSTWEFFCSTPLRALCEFLFPAQHPVDSLSAGTCCTWVCAATRCLHLCPQPARVPGCRASDAPCCSVVHAGCVSIRGVGSVLPLPRPSPRDSAQKKLCGCITGAFLQAAMHACLQRCSPLACCSVPDGVLGTLCAAPQLPPVPCVCRLLQLPGTTRAPDLQVSARECHMSVRVFRLVLFV